MTRGNALLIGMVMTAPSLGFGQALVARTTEMNYQANYGGGGNLYQPSGYILNDSVQSVGNEGLTFSDTKSGVFGGTPWNASVSVALSHSYALTGNVLEFSQITSVMDGTTEVSDSQTAGSGAGITSQVPGNSLMLDFDLASTIDYRLFGALSWNVNGAVPRSRVTLLKWNGLVWTTVYDTASSGVPNPGSFDVTGTLVAGSYRLHSQAQTNSISQSTTFTHNEYTFQNLSAVPEPGTLAVLGLGAFFVGRRKRS